eukprot:1490269-Amphidinium_carterae.1
MLPKSNRPRESSGNHDDALRHGCLAIHRDGWSKSQVQVQMARTGSARCVPLPLLLLVEDDHVEK